MAKRMSKAQREVLERMVQGDEVYLFFNDDGKLIRATIANYMYRDEPITNSAAALLKRGLIECKYLIGEITPAGRAALEEK